MKSRRTVLKHLAGMAALAASPNKPAWGQHGKQYDVGVTDEEIRLGQTMPYSGPASGLSVQGHTDVAFFEALNAKGGINGRKIRLVSLDDGYSPPKAVEQTRKLVEHEQVFAIYHSLGTPTNSATYRYLNAQGVPQMFIISGADKFRDPVSAPWTTAIVPALSSEGRAFARHILASKANVTVGILYQNDDFGRDMLKGFREGLGSRAKTVVALESSYEVTDPTVDSQVVALMGAKVDTLVLFATPRFAALALRKAAAIGWRPTRYLAAPSANIATVLRPLGVDLATGVIAVKFIKDPADPAWDQDAGMLEYRAFMKDYRPGADPADFDNAFAFTANQLMAHLLKKCGDHLTRENLMRHALSVRDLSLPLLMPGILMNTSSARRAPIDEFQMVRFDGRNWNPVGGITRRN